MSCTVQPRLLNIKTLGAYLCPLVGNDNFTFIGVDLARFDFRLSNETFLGTGRKCTSCFCWFFLLQNWCQLQMEISFMIYDATSDKWKQKSEQWIAGSQCQLQRRVALQTRFPHVLDQLAYPAQFSSSGHNSLTQRHIWDPILLVSSDQPHT